MDQFEQELKKEKYWLDLIKKELGIEIPIEYFSTAKLIRKNIKEKDKNIAKIDDKNLDLCMTDPPFLLFERKYESFRHNNMKKEFLK